MTPASFYAQAQPLVEQLLTLARDWRDAAPADESAIEAHGEFMWLAIRVDLRLSRARENDSRVPVTAAAPAEGVRTR